MEIDIKDAAGKIVGKVNSEVASRAFRAANELRNSALEILKNSPKRTGRRYRKPHSKSYYTASAPGEPPAQRSPGGLRHSWKATAASEGVSEKTFTIKPAITTNVKYAPMLQDGTKKIAPRPFKEPIVEKAKNKVSAIFKEPYLNK